MAIFNRQAAKEEEEKQKEAYANRLLELRRDMLREHDQQRLFYQYNFLNSAESIQLALAAKSRVRDSDVLPTQRLWERRVSDPDFCEIRLGVGSRPSTVSYKFDGDDIDDPQTRLAVRLMEDSQYVHDVPISIPLRGRPSDSPTEPAKKVSPRHAIGITGESAYNVDAFVSSVLLNFVTLQSPHDTQLLVLSGAQSAIKWRWVRNLPHSQAIRSHEAICIEDEADRKKLEKEDSKVYGFLKALRNRLNERQLRLRDKDSTDPTLPFLLVVADLSGEFAADTRIRDLETDPGISLLMQTGMTLGAAILFITNSVDEIPSGCKTVIEITANNDEEAIKTSIMFRYAETGVNSPRYLGQADVVEDPRRLQQFTNALQSLSVRKSYGASLPRSVHLMDMMKAKTIAELRESTRKRWDDSIQADQADWLKSTLGMLSGGDYRTLKFAADADGVHGMVAGSTGSGKSELLMTMILSLALNYDPRIVNFVLVDYKGGGAFEPLKKLPHVVDVVTNLGESAVMRMFAAVQAELNRRSSLNTNRSVKHIVEYREKGLHTRYPAPYPHLFIFIDEFAEMMQSNPEFKAQLNSITRLGRAIGVTLILAAQRPTGVTDQMRANIKFRIALRVETPEESSEILRRRDAAYLPTGMPGRGYLQVGNESVELIQIAWSGANYIGEQEKIEPKVVWKNRPKSKPKQLSSEPRRVFEEVVDMLGSLAEDVSTPQRKPWPDFLPVRLSLQTLLDMHDIDTELLGDDIRFAGIDQAVQERQSPLNPYLRAWANDERSEWVSINWKDESMRAVVGLVDNPYQRAQFPLLIDFRRGHAVIFGASGWGKTTFLRTTLMTLAATHSPAELHAYILDFGGRQLQILKDLPHVGDVIASDREEQVKRLLRSLTTKLEQRKILLGELGMNQWSFNAEQTDAAKRLPSILLLIDNYAEFKESFEHLRDQMISIAREGRAFGIHMIVSAELPNAVDSKLYGLLTERMTLKLSDPTEYGGIVGRGARTLDELEGRGFVKVGKRALEFQTALPVGSQADLDLDANHNRKLRLLIGSFNNAAENLPEQSLPKEIETLKTLISLDELLKKQPATASSRIQPLIGIDDFTLQAWPLKLSVDGPQCLVLGLPFTGKTTLLRTFGLSLAAQYSPEQARLILIDFQHRLIDHDGERLLSELPHVLTALTTPEKLPHLVKQLENECEYNASLSKQDRRPLFILIDNYLSFVEEADNDSIGSLAKLERQFGSVCLHFLIAGSPDVTRSPDPLRRQIQNSRLGFALDTDSVDRLNGRIPGALRSAEAPLGRGFIVKTGRTRMLQFATPYKQDESLEADLDRWVQHTIAQYPGQKAMWETIVPEEEEEEPVEAEQDSNVSKEEEPAEAPRQYIPGKTIPKGVDVGRLRQLVADTMRIDVSLTAAMQDIDIYNTAVDKGFIEPPTS
ncbi:MAG: FtsK/SpoIIIE domain-containing protein [Candidatus Promineifilaceae bacterium]